MLSKAASILLNHNIDHNSKFSGNFYEQNLDDSIAPMLLQFVCMMEHGADIKSQLRFGVSKTDFAMAQLLQHNCYALSRKWKLEVILKSARLLFLST